MLKKERSHLQCFSGTTRNQYESGKRVIKELFQAYNQGRNNAFLSPIGQLFIERSA